MSTPFSKIHVTNSTSLSLNDRFTAIASHVPVAREQALKRRRSRSASRGRSTVDHLAQTASLANRRLLQQLARKEKMQAALKLKRRSMKAVGGRAPIKRSGIRTLRVAPNGRPIKTNSLTKVATMRADLIGIASRRPLRRSNSLSSRLGVSRRPAEVGGAAQRVARRQLDRIRRGGPAIAARGRSRSRSRARVPVVAVPANMRRRSLSRGHIAAVGANGGTRGDRSRSRSRARPININSKNNAGARANAALSIKARLGVRPGALPSGRGRNPRRQSIGQRGVAAGRVQKRRNSTAVQNAGGASRGAGRARGRPAVGNAVRRSRSRTRKGSVGQQQKYQHKQQQPQQQQLKQTRSGSMSGRGRRGRSQQRNGQRGTAQKNGNRKGQIGQQQAQTKKKMPQQRRGRQLGPKTPVMREDLDKELDQYMATPKTDVDYLL